ncbi:glycosyltransferase family 2 protein [Riemerella anatipestifer]|nr:glycosyltransferase family 2 protein [Riemerella anatipestifer]
MKKPVITIFTPAYNRANLLPSLYNSLKKQSSKDFEWVIVDDGSIDNTSEVIDEFISEGILSIRYLKKVNEGKHIAINKGVEMAHGELFFIVDSDDVLPERSIDIILHKYSLIKNDKSVAGVVGRRGYISGGVIGTNIKYKDVISTSLHFRFKEKISGDMAEVYRLEILKEYPFPKFEGERFCPEALVWQRIDQKYKMLWFSDVIYEGEYLEGGLTSNIFRIRKESPKASCLYYSSLAKYEVPIFQKLKATANYWRFAIYDNISFLRKMKKVSFGLSVLSLPFILLLILKDNMR